MKRTSSTGKTTAKTTTKKADKPLPEPESMDPTVTEAATGTPSANTARVCWALKTLVAEVDELFPEVPVEYSNYSPRNAALDATFDLTVLDEEDRRVLRQLLETVPLVDERIDWAMTADDAVLVSMRGNARTQDRRDSFRLKLAYSLLAEPKTSTVPVDYTDPEDDSLTDDSKEG